jgi:hypothetical protein|eukprot:5882962-Prymnesium_polylepis.1
MYSPPTAAGSILGLGGEQQVAQLDQIQESGKLGCFLLTEMQAGVLSGLIVETTADYDPATQEFTLRETPPHSKPASFSLELRAANPSVDGMRC